MATGFVSEARRCKELYGGIIAGWASNKDQIYLLILLVETVGYVVFLAYHGSSLPWPSVNICSHYSARARNKAVGTTAIPSFVSYATPGSQEG